MKTRDYQRNITLTKMVTTTKKSTTTYYYYYEYDISGTKGKTIIIIYQAGKKFKKMKKIQNCYIPDTTLLPHIIYVRAASFSSS